jgi:hypothetical protein
MAPERRSISQKRDAWQAALKEAAVTEEIYFVDDKGLFEPVLVKAIPLTGPLLSQAAELWPDDKRLKALLAEWTAGGRSVVLLGYYSSNLKSGADDFMKSSRLQVELVIPGAGPVKPEAPFLMAQDDLADYFPVFNRWEKALVYRFRAGLNPGAVLAVAWPTGRFGLPLIAPLGESAD